MRGLVIAAILVGAVACSLTTSLDGLSVTSRDEAGANDAATAPDDGTIAIKEGGTSTEAGPVGDGAAPTSFLVNGGFEAAGMGSLSCGAPWNPFQAQLLPDPSAPHTGMFACRVCGQSTASFTIDYSYEQSPQVTVGQKVHVRAWLRKTPGFPKSPTVTATIAVYNDAGTEIDPGSDSPPLALSDTWTALDFETTIKTAGLFNLYVADGTAAPGDCFLIDDVSGWFVP